MVGGDPSFQPATQQQLNTSFLVLFSFCPRRPPRRRRCLYRHRHSKFCSPYSVLWPLIRSHTQQFLQKNHGKSHSKNPLNFDFNFYPLQLQQSKFQSVQQQNPNKKFKNFEISLQMWNRNTFPSQFYLNIEHWMEQNGKWGLQTSKYRPNFFVYIKKTVV